MGWFKVLQNANNAEGARESTRLSYKKHLRLAKRSDAGQAGTDDPHNMALYDALASRYVVRGRQGAEFNLWPELLPFQLMK